MGLNIFHVEFSYLDKDPFLRFDVDYIDISKKLINNNNFKFLKEFIIGNIETGKSIKRKDYSENSSEYAHLTVRNIKDGKLDLNNLIYLVEEKGEYLRPYKLEKGDIVIAISSNVGSSFYFDKEIKDLQLTLSHYLTKIRIDETKLNSKLLVYYLNSKLMQSYFKSVETGKTVKNLAKIYIKELPILLPTDLNKQKSILKMVEPIDEDILSLKSKIKSSKEIINDIFSEEFEFNPSKLDELKNEHIYHLHLSDFSDNIDMRCSFKFHRPSGKYVTESLNDITSKKIKNFLDQPINLGKGISPKDYDKNGESYYITMADIKNWEFDSSDAKKVSEDFFLKNKNKLVDKNDILMARSGEGTIGKVALVDREIKAIHADFTMRIKLKNYNPLFAYYYFRTEFFQYLVYIHKKGLGNNTNIFPIQIKEFPLLDISLDEQERIIEKIKLELDNQKEISELINRNKKQISIIIENMVNTENAVTEKFI